MKKVIIIGICVVGLLAGVSTGLLIKSNSEIAALQTKVEELEEFTLTISQTQIDFMEAQMDFNEAIIGY